MDLCPVEAGGEVVPRAPVEVEAEPLTVRAEPATEEPLPREVEPDDPLPPHVVRAHDELIEALVSFRREPPGVRDEDLVRGTWSPEPGTILPPQECESPRGSPEGTQESEKLLLEDGPELGASPAPERVVPVQEERGDLEEGAEPLRSRRHGPRPEVLQELAEVVPLHGGDRLRGGLETSDGVSGADPL